MGDALTSFAACSAEQAATIIKLRPYLDSEDLRVKLGKAKGVSIKLFDQYTEIMEGYVQIDSCLNKCEQIGTEVGHTLSVWRGASMAHDSVVGTPRSDGLNDVKVDVAKVSELLKMETDARKRKILASYIQRQPALLSKGTVLKDYQLLGVNWLNLLYSKKIGCILADEMGGSCLYLFRDCSRLTLSERSREDDPSDSFPRASQRAQSQRSPYDICTIVNSRKLDKRI